MNSRITVAAVVGAVMAGGAAYAFLDYPPCASLGATHEERDAALPGDDLIPNGLQSTRAITIQAPPEAIWPWLVQMGQDRGGFYSHDWLERLFGAEIRNADRIHPEWQTLSVADMVWPYPERKLRAMAKSSNEIGGWRVACIEAERSLVVQSNAGRWTWALVLQPMDGGAARLVARTRFARPEHALSRVVDALVGQPAHLVMEVGVLRGIKSRAEDYAGASSAQPMPTEARAA
jgi:hypothetical protein